MTAFTREELDDLQSQLMKGLPLHRLTVERVMDVLRTANVLQQENNLMIERNIQLTFQDLRRVNLERLPLFKDRRGRLSHSQPDGSDWSLPEWTNAIAGEVGEACNLAKKIRRGDFGEPDTYVYRDALLDLGKEFADVVIYTDIACMRAGLQLDVMVRGKFNEVSERVGCEVFL